MFVFMLQIRWTWIILFNPESVLESQSDTEFHLVKATAIKISMDIFKAVLSFPK